MIIKHAVDPNYVLFEPEDLKERKALDKFPGLLKQKLVFYAPSRQHVIYNLFTRLKRVIKDIKYTKEIQEVIEGDIVIKEIPENFHFHTPPLKHQRIALRFAYTFGNFLNLSEPGLGKTKVTLDYIWLIQAKKSLIVCPKALLFVWEEETLKHRPELNTYCIQSTDWEKEWPKIKQADVVVINYDKAVAFREHLLKIKFDFIAVDEGLIKNPKTERTQAIVEIGQNIPSRCVMSGTLVNNSPLDVWSPLRFIEPSLVGTSFSKFREEYALISRHNRFITVGFRKQWEIKEILASCGIVMTKAEWLNSLPPKEFKHIYVQMSDEQRDYYHQLSANYLLQIPETDIEVEVDNPLSVLMKLNQISNGFIYYKENIEESLDELYGKESTKRSKDTRKVHVFKEQPKADALLKLINSDEFNRPEESSSGEDTSPVDGANNCSKQHISTGVREDRGTGRVYQSCDSNDGSSSELRIGLRDNETNSRNGNVLHRRYEQRRAIIWYNLSAERDILEQVLNKANIPFLVVAGGEKNIGGVVNTFNNDTSYRFLLCQAKTINYGVTVMGRGDADDDAEREVGVPAFDPRVSDEIFYSINFSLELFLQQQDRIHRIGQTRKCRYWILLTNSKVERKIADRLEQKLICNKEIIVDLMVNLDDWFEEEKEIH